MDWLNRLKPGQVHAFSRGIVRFGCVKRCTRDFRGIISRRFRARFGKLIGLLPVKRLEGWQFERQRGLQCFAGLGRLKNSRQQFDGPGNLGLRRGSNCRSRRFGQRLGCNLWLSKRKIFSDGRLYRFRDKVRDYNGLKLCLSPRSLETGREKLERIGRNAPPATLRRADSGAQTLAGGRNPSHRRCRLCANGVGQTIPPQPAAKPGKLKSCLNSGRLARSIGRSTALMVNGSLPDTKL